MKVISGAQIGADIAGLRAAKACGIETGGWIPRGGRIKGGFLPAMVVEQFGLQETSSDGYPMRTLNNVLSSQATIRLAHNFNSPGERLTLKYAKLAHRPTCDIQLRWWDDDWGTVVGPLAEPMLVTDTAMWLVEQQVETVNIAGNADREIESFVEHFLTKVFKEWQQAVTL